MAETPTYSHHDIKRYLQRTMSPQEMHAFEKALMDDPFLADALEGFSAGDQKLADTHLARIQQQLTGEREETKIVPLVVKKGTWWKAAAVVIMIVCGGVISYSLLNKQEDRTPIAQEMTATSGDTMMLQPNQAPAAQKPLAKSAEPVENLSGLQQESAASSRAYSRAAPAPSRLDNRQADEAARVPAAASKSSTIADPVTTEAYDKIEQARSGKASPLPVVSALNEFKGKVTGKNGEPVPFASVTANETRQETTSDAKGEFMLKDPDSVVNVTVNSIGYSTATATLNQRQLNRVALEKESQALSEVVIVGYGSRKKKATTGADSAAAAEPVGGWKNFSQYLNRQIDSLQTTAGKGMYVSDDVVLEFLINREGKPSQIEVPDQINKAVAGKAVEILTNGPRWKSLKKNKKVKVIIPFGSGK